MIAHATCAAASVRAAWTPVSHARPFVGWEEELRAWRLRVPHNARNVRALRRLARHRCTRTIPMTTLPHIAKPMQSREYRDAAACAPRNRFSRLQGLLTID